MLKTYSASSANGFEGKVSDSRSAGVKRCGALLQRQAPRRARSGVSGRSEGDDPAHRRIPRSLAAFISINSAVSDESVPVRDHLFRDRDKFSSLPSRTFTEHLNIGARGPMKSDFVAGNAKAHRGLANNSGKQGRLN